jgi:hypothetical protein
VAASSELAFLSTAGERPVGKERELGEGPCARRGGPPMVAAWRGGEGRRWPRGHPLAARREREREER